MRSAPGLPGIEGARWGEGTVAIAPAERGKSYPRLPMSLNFNLWFIQAGWSREKAPRVWHEDVDWVFDARNRALTPSQVEAAVAGNRRIGISRLDSVPAGDPPLPCRCDL